jgi:putative redox protein
VNQVAMVEIQLAYSGELRCSAVHGPSGKTLITDAPVDNHGKGESFSPTDLVATALGSCMMTVMGIVAERKQLNLSGMKVRVEKHMSADSPRRIVKLPVVIVMPLPSDHPERALLEAAALGCPVHHSLHAGIEKPVSFEWVG